MKRILSMLTLLMYSTQLAVSCGYGVEAPRSSTPGEVAHQHAPLTGDEELPPPGNAVVRSELDGAGLVPGTLAGSFDVTADGAATYKVPLWVPQGRAGIQPSLSLNYNSRGGNGLLGVGWGLGGLSQITRCGKTTVQDTAPGPVMFDSTDALCLDGKRLVQVGTTSGGEKTYATEVEEFSHIVAKQADGLGPQWFEVQLKNGLVLEYGKDGTSRIEGYRMNFVPASSNSGDSSVVGNHTAQSVRYGWSLSRMRDRKGNFMSLEYQLRVHGNSSQGYAYEQLPVALRYTGSTTDASVATPGRAVLFHYQEMTERPDRIERFVSGLKLVGVRRLESIAMHGPGGGPEALRSYRLAYRNDSISGRSLLATLQECDANSHCKRPTAFTWELSGPGHGREALPEEGDDYFLRVPVSGATPSPLAYSNTLDEEGFYSAPDFWTLQTLDINGDGRDDIMYRASTVSGGRRLPPKWYARLNTNGRDFGPATQMSTLPESLSGDGADDLRTVDLNNDGKVDVVGLFLPDVESGTHGRYEFFLSNGTGFTGTQDDIYDFWFDQTKPVRTPAMHLADLDGNGYPDVVRSLTRASGSSLPYEWGARMTGVASGGAPVFPATHQRTSVGAGLDHAGYAVDVDGDGAVELLVREPQSNLFDSFSRFFVAIGRTGPGVIGKKLTTTLPALPVMGVEGNLIHRQHWFMDINGDGLPDSVSAKRERQGLTDGGSLMISINTGNGFSPPVTQTLPPGAQVSFSRIHPQHRFTDTGVRVMDFNLDGKQDLLLTDSSYGVDPGPATRLHHVVLESNGTGFTVRNLAIPVGQPTGRGNLQSVSADDPAMYSYKGSGWGMKFTQLLDANGDGLTDIIQMEGGQFVLYLRNAYKPDVLKQVTDGLNNTATVTFEATTFVSPSSVANHHTPGTCVHPQSCNMRAQWLVVRHAETGWDSATRDFSYTYAGGRTDLLGRGWLGFSSRTVHDLDAAKQTTSRYHNDQRTLGFYLEAHRPYEEQTTVTLAPGVEDSFQRNLEYAYQSKAAGKVVFPYVSRVTENEVSAGYGTVRHQESTNEYDAYGNLTRHEEDAPDGTSLVTVSTYDNYPVAGSHLLGLLRRQSVTSTVPGASSVTRTKAYEYCDGASCQPTSNLPRRVFVEPDAVSPEREDVWLQSEFTYNALGLVTRLETTDTAARKRRTELQYDAAERMFVSAQLAYPAPDDPNGPVLRTDYAYQRALGVPTLQQNPNGVRTRWYYDAWGRPRAEDGPDTADATLSYSEEYGRPLITARDVDLATCGSNAHGLDFATCLRNGNESLVRYDSLGREIRRRTRGFDGGWTLVELEYDGLGRVETASMPRTELGPVLKQRFEYDKRGRLRFVRNPDGTYQEKKHEGLKTLSWDEKRNHGYVVEDGLGRVVRSANVMSSGTILTQYEYGPFGLPRRVIDASSNATLLEFDRLGRRTLLDDPDSGLRRTWYSAFGDVRSQTDGNGNTVSSEYDGMGRGVSLSNQPAASGSPAQVTSFVWDTAVNGLGALHTATSPDGVVQTHEYDALSRPVQERWSIQGQEYRLSTTYDAQGRIQTLGYPEVAGRARMGVVFNYTGYGHLSSVQNINTGHAYWTATSHNAAGLLTGEAFGNGVTSTRRYDALNQLRFIETSGAAGAVQQLAYDYEANGNLKSRVDRLTQVAESFQYDGVDRLKQWQVSKGCNNAVFQYNYDVLGNLSYRSSRLGTASQAPFAEATYTYGTGTAGPHAVTSVGTDHYAYDGNGNLNQRQLGAGGLRELEYTYFNLPSRVTEGPREWTFGYDASQRRTFKQDNQGNRTVYVGGMYEKRTKPDTTTAHVFYVPGGTGVAAQVEWTDVPTPGAETVAYLHTDNLGSVESVTASGGVVLAHYKHDPFGLRKNASNPALAYNGSPANPRLGFTGHEEDDELGLINMKGRMYDPKLGRFLSPDPVVQAPLFGQSLNRYSYVLNNPLSFTDPTGFEAEDAWGPVIARFDFDDDTIIANSETQVWPAESGLVIYAESSVFEPGEYEILISGSGTGGKSAAGTADPNGSRVSGVEAGAYGVAGLIAGAGMGVGAAYALGAIAAICVPCAVVGGLGMAAVGAYQLVNGGAKALWDSGERIYNGQGTASDYFGVGAVVGGVASGRLAKPAFAMGQAHGGRAANAVMSAARARGRVGGGSGPWADEAMDVQPGGAVSQSRPGSCVSACGEMLTGGAKSEAAFLAELGEWSTPEALAESLGGGWQGGWFGGGADAMAAAGRGPMGAVLWSPGGRSGHMVVIESVKGGFLVRDPLPGVTYRVTSSWMDKFVAAGVWR
ncbi:RHS repeat-associated core domain-containing protein [Corallococcus terminator]